MLCKPTTVSHLLGLENPHRNWAGSPHPSPLQAPRRLLGKDTASAREEKAVRAGGCRRTSALGPPEISPEIPLSCTKFLAGLALWGPGWKSTESASPSLTGALSAWRSPAASPVISSLGPPTDVNSKERLTLTWLFQSPRYAFPSISDSRNFFLLIKVLLSLLPAVSGICP